MFEGKIYIDEETNEKLLFIGQNYKTYVLYKYMVNVGEIRMFGMCIYKEKEFKKLKFLEKNKEIAQKFKEVFAIFHPETLEA